MTLFGIDVSRYQNDVNWTQVKAAGISFATIKASEGTANETYATTRDYFRREFRELQASGILPGAYHVIRSVDTAAQIDWFLDQIVAAGGDPSKCILQLDYEKWSYDFPSYAKLKSCVVELKRRVPGAKPIMYTGKWVWDQVTGEPANAAADLGVSLWDSNYGTNPAVGYRTAYPGDDSYRWRSYGGWTTAVLQYGSRTSVGGVSGYCDANAYRGTLADLKGLLIATANDAPTPGSLDIGSQVPLAQWIVEMFKDDPGVADGSLYLETTLAASYAYPRLLNETLATAVLPMATQLLDAEEKHAGESAQRDGLILALLRETQAGNLTAEEVVEEIGKLLIEKA